MGRQPCCDKLGVKKGPWTAEEDKKLINFILTNGQCCWRAVPKLAGLRRCGKSCRLRWTNYLRPDLKRGLLTEAEEQLVIDLHSRLGNRSTSHSIYSMHMWMMIFICSPNQHFVGFWSILLLWMKASNGFLSVKSYFYFFFPCVRNKSFSSWWVNNIYFVFLWGCDTRLFSTFPLVGQSLSWKYKYLSMCNTFGDNVFNKEA